MGNLSHRLVRTLFRGSQHPRESASSDVRGIVCLRVGPQLFLKSLMSRAQQKPQVRQMWMRLRNVCTDVVRRGPSRRRHTRCQAGIGVFLVARWWCPEQQSDIMVAFATCKNA